MNLRELEAYFVKRGADDGHLRKHVDSINDAEGITFLCPLCYQKNGGNVGTHGITCWAPQVPDNILPGPGRWNLVGTGIDDLTLKAGSSSVLLTSGCRAHFYVREGQIVWC